MKKRILAVAALAALCSNASALSILVAPSTGVPSTPTTNTIADAIAQINAGVDTHNAAYAPNA
ncbi:MAG TPA: hypothetical protein PKD58_04025, partial [Candidatus Sumerlaeota bacterium]|nr:hypothetical protein [Candidatus Sumerlaeota bacterium]